MMLACGGGLHGGRVYGRWPGLADADLSRGDLQVTTDYREVLAEFLQRRPAGLQADVFPDFIPAGGLGLFRAS